MSEDARSCYKPAGVTGTRRARKLGLTLGSMAACVLALSLGVMLILPHEERVLPGVQFRGTALGGMTHYQALATINDLLAGIAARQVTMVASSAQWRFTLHDLGVRADLERLVQQASAAGREGTILQRLALAVRARHTGLSLSPSFTLDGEVAANLLGGIAVEIDRPEVNAAACWDDAVGHVVVTGGDAGWRLDIDGTLARFSSEIVEVLNTGGEAPATLEIVVAEREPRITREMLAPIDTVLGTFTTSYATSSRNRASNIETAARSIHGRVMMPGDLFSFNAVVGPRTSGHGFRTAPVISDGQLTPGIGGGICQVSTTLYNAALLANMEIVERRHHSLPVSYVPAGQDATVVDGAIDFKFRNATGVPIVVETTTRRRTITARILGRGPAPVVRIERSGLARTAGRVITRQDPSLPAGERVVTSGRAGLAVTVTRVVGSGTEVTREVISRDRYPGEPSLVRMGTGPAVAGSATVSSMQIPVP